MVSDDMNHPAKDIAAVEDNTDISVVKDISVHPFQEVSELVWDMMVWDMDTQDI